MPLQCTCRIYLLCLAASLTSPSWGEDPIIKGKVLGHNGTTPVPRAQISVVETDDSSTKWDGETGENGEYEIVLKGCSIPERVKIRVLAIGCQPATTERTVDVLEKEIDDILLDANPHWAHELVERIESASSDAEAVLAQPPSEKNIANFKRVAASFKRITDLRWQINETRFMERRHSPLDAMYLRNGYETIDNGLIKYQDQLLVQLNATSPITIVYNHESINEVRLRYGDEFEKASASCQSARNVADKNFYGPEWWDMSNRLSALTRKGKFTDANSMAVQWSSNLNRKLVGNKAIVLHETSKVSYLPEFTGTEAIDHRYIVEYMNAINVFSRCAWEADKGDLALQDAINIKLKPLVVTSVKDKSPKRPQ